MMNRSILSVLALGACLGACDKSPEVAPPPKAPVPLPPKVAPAPSSSPSRQPSAPAPQATPKPLADPETLARARAKVEQGLALLQKKDPQAARKAFFEATTLVPRLDQAQLGLARASFEVGNKHGAHAAAQLALLHTQDVLVRAQALDLLRKTPPESPETWQQPSFYEKYLAYTLLTMPEDERPVPLSQISPATLKPAQDALAQRDKIIQGLQCEDLKLQGPFASPKALCDAMGSQHECVWGSKPAVSSAPQSLVLSLNTEDTSDTYMVMGRKKTWFAVPLAQTTHASSGHVHENMTPQTDELTRADDNTLTLRASARVRRGQDDQAYGEFYKSEDTTRVLCVWGQQAPACKRALVRARRTIFATKLGQNSQHAVLAQYGPDHTGGSSDWDTLPNGCAP